MPLIAELIKKTHTKADGTFVDKYAEEIFEEVQILAAQMSAPTHEEGSEGGSQESSGTPTLEVMNKAFYAHVPRTRDIDLVLVQFNIIKGTLHQPLLQTRTWRKKLRK